MKRFDPLIKRYSRLIILGLFCGAIAQPVLAQTDQNTVMVKGDQSAIASRST
jgi:hypothetical protein